MRKSRSERRKQPRVSGRAGLKVGAEPHVSEVNIKDISLAGLCFIADRPIGYMSRLMMTLLFPGESKNPTRIRCEGTVVRCDPVKGSEGKEHEVAVFFTHLDDASRETIEDYVRTHL